jgi:tape measure domain-containing protein
MTTQGERLLISLEARVNKYERDLARARQRTDRHMGAMQARALATAKSFKASFASIAAPLAGVASVRGATALIDATLRIDNALKVAGLSGEALEKVYDELFAAAQANAAPLETLVGLYAKLSLVQKELGVDQTKLVGFTNNVALALRAGGTDAQAASGALLQLSQALGGGTVRAEEFNSVLEGAPTIAQAVATGLQEAGGSVAKLRQLVVDGQVSSRAFFRAFEAGAPMLKEKVADAAMTIDQRMTNLGNALLDAARRFNTSSKAADTFGTAIDNVSGIVNGIDFDSLISQIQEVIGAFQAGVQWAQNFAQSVGQASGLDKIGKFLTGGQVQKSFLGGALTVTSSAALQERIDAAFESQIEKAGELTEEAILRSVLGQGGGVTDKTDRLPKTEFKPISIEDYPADDSSGTGGTGRGSSGGAGRGASAGSGSTSDFQRQLEDAQRRAELLRQETTLLAGINPALDRYGAKAEAASMKASLLTAAQQEGIAVTPQVTAQIDQVAEGYAKAAEEAARLAEEQDNIRQRAEELANLGGSVVSGFISDLRQGKTASEALANALNKVIDQLIDMMIQALIVKPLMGIFSGFFPGFEKGGPVPGFDRGGYTGPGGRKTPAGVVHAGEVVWSQDDVRRAGGVANVEALRTNRVRGFADGGAVGGSSRIGAGGQVVNFAPQITVNAAQGGDPKQNRDLAEQTARQIEHTIRGMIGEEMRAQMRPGGMVNRRG